MKIVSIFELSYKNLFAVKYEGEDLNALEILQEQWLDVEFLREFFIMKATFPRPNSTKLYCRQLKMQMPYLSCFMIWQRIIQENP